MAVNVSAQLHLLSYILITVIDIRPRRNVFIIHELVDTPLLNQLDVVAVCVFLAKS